MAYNVSCCVAIWRVLDVGRSCLCRLLKHRSFCLESESSVVVVAVAQTTVDEAHQFHGASETEPSVVLSEYVLIEDIAQALFLYGEFGDEVVVAPQRCLVLQVHACHHGVDALLVQFGEAHAELCQVQMPCVLYVVQIVGVVHYTLDVALVVAHFHFRFKCVFHI